MELLRLLICLGLSSVAVAQGVIDPRGVRPVEHGTRSEKCATQKEWPFCTTDDWGPKCPSGCRIQGLMDKYDHTLLKKVEKIRGLLDQNTVKHRSTDEVSKQTYDYLKEKLTTDAGNDNNYYDLAQSLRRRITEMKIKIDKQLRLLAALKDRVKDQVIEMQRLEVDIDIKLRSCKGSCSGYAEYQVDQESYVALDKQIDQLDSRSDQQIETVGTLYVMKSRVLKEEVVPSVYKSGITGATAEAQKTEDVFPDVNTLELILEEEGSSSSPATVSKDPEVCLRLKQKNQVGRQSFTRSRWHKKQQCRVKPDPGLCSDDDWVSKCPSGCRLQGLIKNMENEAERKLWTVCKTGQMHEDAAEKSMKTMTHVYDSNRRVIVARYVSELKFAEHAEELAKNLTSLRKRSSRLSQQFKDLLRNVQKQVDDLYRTEVDIDMKLRTCLGSCQSALQFSVDHDSYHLFHNDMDQMDKTLNQRNKAVTPPEDIPHIRLQPVDIVLAPSAEYKTIPTVQKELLNLFEDVAPNHLLLDEPLKDSTDGQVLDLAELEWNEI